MTAPVGTPPELASWIQRLEDRIAVMETPMGPTLLFPIASASLSIANAATYINCQVFVTDLNCIAHSNGAHWYNEISGATII